MSISPAGVSLSDADPAARRAVVALLAGVALIALAPIFARLTEVGPLATSFGRAFFALPLLWIWNWRASHHPLRRPAPDRRARMGLIVAGLFFAGDLATFHWGVRLTSVANIVLIANLAPIMVTGFAVLFLGERVTQLFLVGCFVATAGTAALMGDSLAFATEHLAGDGVALLIALFYAAYLLSIRHLRRGLDTATIMAWSTAATAVVLVPLVLLEGGPWLPQTAFGWAMILGQAWICHVGGQGLIAYALAHLPASFAAVNMLLQPLLSVFFAWFLLSEAVGPWQAAGALGILAGLWLANRARPRGR